MRTKASLLAALFLLALPAAAQAHVTFWEVNDAGYNANYFEGSQAVGTFGCGTITAVDADPNTPTPQTRYMEVAGASYRFGAALQRFEEGSHFHSAGGVLVDTFYNTIRFLHPAGYPADQELGTKNHVLVNPFGVTFDTLKLHAYGGLWLVKRLC